MITTSAKSQRSRHYKPAGSSKCNVDYMASLSLAMAGCQKVADSSHIPGLSILFFIAQGIVDTVQGARNNVTDAARLAERVCKLVEAISEQSQGQLPMALPAKIGSYPTLEENLRVFHGTLEQIQLLLPEITERSWFMAALHVLQDRQSLQDIDTELNHAMTLFQVRNAKSLQENIKELQHDMMGLHDDMKRLKVEMKSLRDMMEKLDNTLRTMNLTLSKIEEQYIKGLTIPPESCASASSLPVAKVIAETVKSNVDDAARLTERICKQAEGVPAGPGQPESHTQTLPSTPGDKVRSPPAPANGSKGSRR
ncbi:hypothetical protein K439DRAFT_144422 [Ramaria rubella]|nr:hypothetical protein K439DRAFT_144422 [Ramaria rubella]